VEQIGCNLRHGFPVIELFVVGIREPEAVDLCFREETGKSL
jgi:hypothetical protein